MVKENTKYGLLFLFSFLILNIGYELYRIEGSWSSVSLIIAGHIGYTLSLVEIGRLSVDGKEKTK